MRSYHLHPDFITKKVERLYIATNARERAALKRRGWTKAPRHHLTQLLQPHGRQLESQLTATTEGEAYQSGTFYVSRPRAMFGQDEADATLHRVVHEGLHTPDHF